MEIISSTLYFVGLLLLPILIFWFYSEKISKKNNNNHSDINKKYSDRKICPDCKKWKVISEFEDNTFGYEGFFTNCFSCRHRWSKPKTSFIKPETSQNTNNQSNTSNLKPKNTKQNSVNKQRSSKLDSERKKNKKNFGKELTNEEILNLFEIHNISLDFESKKRIENQLNGIISIKELPFEVDSIRKEEFKRLNTIGIWYDINNKRFVRFPKSDKFWKSAGGKDGTRGVDDWASK